MLPKFEAADVHVSAKSTSLDPRTVPAHGGRYEFKNATMLDLIRTAYGVTADKVYGGPSWLEIDRFDVIAQEPPNTTPDAQKAMLQALLEDRFKLVAHKDTKPQPTKVLTVGKKLQLKEADGAGETGCQAEGGGSAPGGSAIVIGTAVAASMGVPTRIALGPGGTIHYICRNMTMQSFAESLRGMMGTSVGTNPVLDETGLKGKYNFDLRYSILSPMPGTDAGDRISISEAIDKQLGLKFEERPVPTPVIVVDSVNRKPSENPPGTAEALPAIPVPTEFEVASIKPSEPPTPSAPRIMGFRMQPGGRFIADGMTLRMLVTRAFNTLSGDQLVGLPPWADTERFDIVAKAPSEGATSGVNIDMEALGPMIRALLVDRFKMTYHTEERQVTGYALVAVKPRMKKADPESRASCKNGNATAGTPAGSRVLICQNITMEQFADRLRGLSLELTLPILDATEIAGGWDFALSFDPNAAVRAMVAGRGGGDPNQTGAVAASDPSGGLTIFEAIEKQLGLKLEKQKRQAQVIVIDHIEQKPTEN